MVFTRNSSAIEILFHHHTLRSAICQCFLCVHEGTQIVTTCTWDLYSLY